MAASAEVQRLSVRCDLADPVPPPRAGFSSFHIHGHERTVVLRLFVVRLARIASTGRIAQSLDTPTYCPTSPITARTALYLCSVTLISLMAGECRAGTEVDVANLPKVCRTATEGVLSPSYRTCTTYWCSRRCLSSQHKRPTSAG